MAGLCRILKRLAAFRWRDHWALFDAGLYCRADDRGDPVVQLAPPLICDQQHFDEIEQILRNVLTDAWTHI